MSAGYLDAHCHIDRYPSPPDVLAEAATAGVVIVAVTELPSEFQRLALRLGKRPLVRLALGMHPLRASEITPMERTLFARLLPRTDYVGEVGLDGSRHGRDSLPSQRRVFLSVHSRGAETEVIEQLAEAKVTAALHWYTGARKHLPMAVAAGMWFSVNPAMTRSQSGQRVLAELPKERVITETDGPWAKLGGRACRPADMPGLVTALARIWSEEPEAARQRVIANMAAMAAAARTTLPS